MPPLPGAYPVLFADRREAGRQLAARLIAYARRPDAVVLGLPRGGVIVAAEVARALEVQLDVFVVRKLGAPGQEELAMGAVASGGACALNREIIGSVGLSERQLERAVTAAKRDVADRERRYRGEHPGPVLRGRAVIVVDDGLATGATMRAAVQAIRIAQPARLIVAVPVASWTASAALEREVDELVCLRTPEPFGAVGIWYADFEQVTDEQVREALTHPPGRLAKPDPPAA
jgi:putative phosphoribosyl transferase